MFTHFSLKFFTPGIWEWLTTIPGWEHSHIFISDSFQSNQTSPVRQQEVNDEWLGWACKRKCHHVFLSTTLQWANIERRKRKRQIWVFHVINTAWKSFCEDVISIKHFFTETLPYSTGISPCTCFYSKLGLNFRNTMSAQKKIIKEVSRLVI